MFYSLYVSGSGAGRVLEFSTATGNSGYAPLTAARDAFELDHNDGHNHLHFSDFVEYRLLGPTGQVAANRKTGFCFVNSYAIRTGAPYDFPDFGGCRTINPGYADVYGAGLTGQEIDLAGVPDGTYTLDYKFDPDGKLVEADEKNNEDSSIVIRLRGSAVEVPPELNP